MDRLYLQADTAWRSGALAAALKLLEQALLASPESSKCVQRLQFLQQLQAHDARSEHALETGSLYSGKHQRPSLTEKKAVMRNTCTPQGAMRSVLRSVQQR